MSKAETPDGTPAEYRVREMNEVLGVAAIGRAANPDARVETLDELLHLGEVAIGPAIDNEVGRRDQADD